MLCASAVFAAVPMLRARRPAGAVGVIVAAAVLAIANSLVSSDLVNALVYERGPIGPAPNAQTCATLAQGVRRANGDEPGQSGPDGRPEYSGAVQAYLADGCGGEGRDLRSLRQALRPRAAPAPRRWPKPSFLTTKPLFRPGFIGRTTVSGTARHPRTGSCRFLPHTQSSH